MKVENYVARTELILEACRGKRILHLGCVGFTDCSRQMKFQQARNSLHAVLSKAGDCTGIDLDGETVEELRKAEVFDNVLVGDVERLTEFHEKLKPFDVVIAGDIIEHVSNPGLMLDGIKALMKSEGRLLVSTPNAFGIANFLRFIRGTFKEGAQHVLSFNSLTLQQLLERHGYEVVRAQTCYQDLAKEKYGASFSLLKRLLERFPEFGGTLSFTCKLRND